VKECLKLTSTWRSPLYDDPLVKTSAQEASLYHGSRTTAFGCQLKASDEVSNETCANISLVTLTEKATHIQRADFESSTERNQHVSPFLQLPAEIRNMIYTHTLQGNMLIIARKAGRVVGLRSHPRGNASGLLYVCRQIYYESAALLFANSTLRLGHMPMRPDSKGRESLLKHTPAELQSTRSIYFLSDSHDRPINDFEFLDMFPKLRTMQIRHVWHDSLVNITTNALEVVSKNWAGQLRYLRRQRKSSLQGLVDRLQAWKPIAKISVRMVEKHAGTTRW
jgi:hypothetical protein